MTQLIRVLSVALLVNASTGFADKPTLENDPAQLNVSLGNFLAVSCDTTGNICTAVGRDEDAGNPGLLVYQSQDAGLSWSETVALAKPSEAKSNVEEIAQATDIHCDSSGQKCHVISSTKINSAIALLAYNNVNNQQTWSEPVILSMPKSHLQKDGRYVYAKLSCSYSGFSCIIAGSLRVGIGSLPLIYTTRDAGNHWAPAKPLREPRNTYPDGVSLYSVHCDNSGFLCKAVGYALTQNSFWSNYYTAKPVVYTTEDGGANWGNPVVLPSDVDKLNKVSTLTDVTCDGTGMQCIAMGITEDLVSDTDRYYSFTTINGGKSWENKQWINPNYSNESFAALNCDNSMVNCTVVGSEARTVQPRGFYLKGLIYSTTTNASSWEKNTDQSFSAFSYLTDVFCGKYNEQCLAVGVDENNSIRRRSLMAQQKTNQLSRKLPAITEPK